MTEPTPERLTLRDFPLAIRLLMTVFLLSVGLGYFSALIQLHFQHAQAGELMPTGDDAVRIFHGATGEKPKSKIEQLLEAPETEKFNGSGQMRSALTTKTEEWRAALRDKVKELAKGEKPTEEHVAEANKFVRESKLGQEREGERLAILEWVGNGAKKKEFEKFPVPASLAKQSITEEFLKEVDNKKVINIGQIITTRCVECHGPNGEQADFPLNNFAAVKKYTVVQTATAMSLTKLAQTTHVHLLGFSMLYGLTGLILAFSSYPCWVRVLICPLPLVAQVIDISCWWLARFDPLFAHVIIYTGGAVAFGLMLHIVLSLLNMYRAGGKIILLLMFAGAAGGGYFLKTEIIDPYLVKEKAAATEAEE